jgi:hypothetical protein
VGDDCDHAAIQVLFGSRKWTDRREAIRNALRDRHADSLLAQMLPEADHDKTMIAAALGDLRGDSGTAALREVIRVSGPRTRDLRCAALLAFAKRSGVDATPELCAALTSPDGAVKDYAVIGLAGVGDDRAWSAVFDRLCAISGRGSRTMNLSEVDVAVAYLAQHLGNDVERRRRLVESVRRHWSKRRDDEREWFATYWPDAQPGGPSPNEVQTPDPNALRAWVRGHMFQPLPMDTLL